MAYGNPLAYQGVGCAIPFISTLTKMYPQAQFIVTGVLGPKSNAHGPNEFLHVGYAKGLTLAISHVVAAHFLLAPR
ncbi:hypothetical_protein [Leishmania braziliensis MHOM/BR/75/M2904]|nr:hypothetical_protein [Leishmania braziliensis MHOM/BR/75/M2904]